MHHRWRSRAPACAGVKPPLVPAIFLLRPEWLAMLAALPWQGGAHG